MVDKTAVKAWSLSVGAKSQAGMYWDGERRAAEDTQDALGSHGVISPACFQDEALLPVIV